MNSIANVKTLRFYPRSLARSVAKAKMRRAGINHINKRFGLFEEWKRWVMAPIKLDPKKSGPIPRKRGKH